VAEIETSVGCVKVGGGVDIGGSIRGEEIVGTLALTGTGGAGELTLVGTGGARGGGEGGLTLTGAGGGEELTLTGTGGGALDIRSAMISKVGNSTLCLASSDSIDSSRKLPNLSDVFLVLVKIIATLSVKTTRTAFFENLVKTIVLVGSNDNDMLSPEFMSNALR
jgi:hypothetical protein